MGRGGSVASWSVAATDRPADAVSVTATAGPTDSTVADVGARPRPASAAIAAADGYRIIDELGRGGMGRVLRAEDQRLGREVAVKQLVSETAAARARFEREARITARLQHPAIVPVYEARLDAGGAPFYAMKLVTGRTLAEMIRSTRTLTDRMALLRHVVAVADAMAYAHSRRVIHRDLKASNVVVGEFAETIVIDWGLAKDLSSGDDPVSAEHGAPRGSEELTVDGAIMGTPAYMPPEQAEGEPVDERADVYALGVMLYHLIAGEMPYAGASSADVLAAVLAGPPRPLLERVPAAPRDLAAIVAKAMARAPADRYPSALELAR
ncbi:MAG: serine/threonine protein kinase, partial [Deltaproteobacteria bacterium]|nr:serine/threonine protein kinase [Kofleriaceae bacterium]